MRYAFECSAVMFCCGPCVSMDAETQNLRWMKPYNGGRYRKRTWSMLDGGQVDLLNIRTCAMCNDRYHEQMAAKDIAWEDRDARAILRKFGQCSESNVPDIARNDAQKDVQEDAQEDVQEDAQEYAQEYAQEDVQEDTEDDFIMI